MARELTIQQVENDADNDMMPFYGFLKNGQMSILRHPGYEVEELARKCAINNYEFWDFNRESKEFKEFLEVYKKEMVERCAKFIDADGEEEIEHLNKLLSSDIRLVMSIG